ncbi:MAG TPA: hypothetical protein VHV77_13340 [Pirellulales bacterium]|nr:hypothetical protein [Pirellulales bacterium]
MRPIILIALLFEASTASAQTDPKSLVRQAIDAHGGEELLAKYPAATATLRGTMIIAGTELSFTGSQKQSIPGKFRLETHIALLGINTTVVQIVNGAKVWQTADGQDMPLVPAIQQELRQMAVMQEYSMLTPLLDAKRFTLKSEKRKEAGDKLLAVGVKAKGLQDVTLYFNKTNGLLAAMQRQTINPEMRQVTERTTFEDYQQIDGVMVPMKQVTTHDGKPFSSVAFSDYKLLEKIDDSEFSIP